MHEDSRLTPLVKQIMDASEEEEEEEEEDTSTPATITN